MVQATKAAVELSILAAMIWGGELGADPGCVLTTCSTEGFRHGRKNSGAGRLLKQGDL